MHVAFLGIHRSLKHVVQVAVEAQGGWSQPGVPQGVSAVTLQGHAGSQALTQALWDSGHPWDATMLLAGLCLRRHQETL